MFVRTTALITALAATCLSIQENAQAQGLLGNILRGARPGQSAERAPSSSQDTPVLEMTMRLESGQWVLQESNSQDSIPANSCQGSLPRDLRSKMAWIAAVKPAVLQDIAPNAFIVKDTVDANNPVWRIAIAVCLAPHSSVHPTDGQKADDLLSSLSVRPDDVLAAADKIIKQTDGSFPPPPSRAEIAQQRTDQKYVQVMAFYQANGEFVNDAVNEQSPFDTAPECKTFASKQLREILLKAAGKARPLSESVIHATDGSEYVWIGCVLVGTLHSDAYANYVNTKMTDGRAKEMKSVPVL